MKVLIVSQKEVRQWLPMDTCITAIADALKMLSRGNAVNPLRKAMWLPDESGILGMMPTYLGDYQVMGLKAFSVLPGNQGSQYDTHQGFVLLFETKNGCPLAIMDASEITAIRTAAASAVATKLLANEDANNLAILGSGVQANKHLEAMLLCRDIRKVRVWSRNFDNAKAFAQRGAERFDIEIKPMTTAQETVDGADIICTTTWASEPILRGDWLTPGTHINAVGASVPFMRELDTQAIVRSCLFVDRRESALNEAGDFIFPKQEGAINDDHILGEIGEILLEQVKGRQSAQEITLFKSLGLALEDVGAAHCIYQKMLTSKAGNWIEFGGDKENA